MYRTIRKLAAVYPRKTLPSIVSFLLTLSAMLFFIRLLVGNTFSLTMENPQAILVSVLGILVATFLCDLLYQNYRWYSLRLIKDEVDPHGVIDLVKHASWPRLIQSVLVKDLLILLGLLLFVLPGILVAYALNLAPQYYLEKQDFTMRQAFSQSIQSMKTRGLVFLQIQLVYSWAYWVPIILFALFNWNNQQNIQIAIEMGQDFVDLVFGMLTGVFALVVLLLFVIALFVEPKKAYMKQLLFILTTEQGEKLEKEFGEEDE